MSDIDSLIKRIQNEADDIIKKKSYEVCISSEIIDAIKTYYSSLLLAAEQLEDRGITIDRDNLGSHIVRLREAVEYRDSVQLYDVLKYEILNTLMIIKDIFE